jgi:hypothetical protein
LAYHSKKSDLGLVNRGQFASLRLIVASLTGKEKVYKTLHFKIYENLINIIRVFIWNFFVFDSDP